MAGKPEVIVLEEHFHLPEVNDLYPPADKNTNPALVAQLNDLGAGRIAEMDKHGIDMCILSLNAPAIQAVWDRKRAVELARQSNDYIAEQVAKNPKRFRAVAALAMQDPDESARELTRCVKELGFLGALVNGFSQVDKEDSAVFYDLPQYSQFWGVVEQLGVNADQVAPAAKFIEDLGADSLDIVELVMAMEEAFGVDIPDEEAENIRTVDDAVSFIKKAEDA